MINGELIVDNFAGVVCGRAHTKLENRRRAERTAPVCVKGADMQEVFENIVEKLEKLADEAYKSYCIGFNSDDRAEYDAYINAIEIFKQEAEKYEECYKDCGDCEAYNKEKHHCPKFCKVIKETVKEIEENHNGWVPCSERLPEEAFGCLVTVMDCNPSAQTEFENILPYFVGYDGESWNDEDGNEIPFEVIAWQPLPEPFKESD